MAKVSDTTQNPPIAKTVQLIPVILQHIVPMMLVCQYQSQSCLSGLQHTLGWALVGLWLRVASSPFSAQLLKRNKIGLEQSGRFGRPGLVAGSCQCEKRGGSWPQMFDSAHKVCQWVRYTLAGLPVSA